MLESHILPYNSSIHYYAHTYHSYIHTFNRSSSYPFVYRIIAPSSLQSNMSADHPLCAYRQAGKYLSFGFSSKHSYIVDAYVHIYSRHIGRLLQDIHTSVPPAVSLPILYLSRALYYYKCHRVVESADYLLLTVNSGRQMCMVGGRNKFPCTPNAIEWRSRK